MAALTVSQQKRIALAWMAKQLIGVTGDGGAYMVKKFQKAVDGVANGEPWCVCFVQYCVREVDNLFDLLLEENLAAREMLSATESTQELWHAHKPESVLTAPEAGAVVVWRLDSNPVLGHCGIVTSTDGESVATVEGNTSDTLNPQGQREGHGVWSKVRAMGDVPGFTRLGYLNPWADAT